MPIPQSDFDRALEVGRPPNVVRAFPNSRALLVSGKVVDRAMRAKGRCMTIAANGRSHVVIRGVLRAAQRANAAVIVEIAKSEGGRSAYCAVNYWNLARQVDAVCNELGIRVPVAIHADHYGIKGPTDVAIAKTEIPTMFEAGITSIAIDASHLPNDENLLASLELARLVPPWAGHETEVGEIKGTEGLSTVQEALFLVGGLNAHGVFPDWIALNNGTAHGIQTSEQGIQVELTKVIHDAIAPFGLSGAQHGTSGNNSQRLRRIAQETRTTKANVATALQMIAWGVKVDDFGNAEVDGNGNLAKVKGQGVPEDLWDEMMRHAADKGWKTGDTKKLNLPFENRILALPEPIRERMAQAVEDFVHTLLTEVFGAQDTAPLAIQALLDANSHDLGPAGTQIEDPADWTEPRIREKAAKIDTQPTSSGDWDD